MRLITVTVLLIITAMSKSVRSTVQISNSNNVGSRPASSSSDRSNCNFEINSIAGACNLHLINFTLLGAHSAGAGAYGHLEFLPGLPAPDCEVRNQDISFTDMLESGVRYFDLKVRHRHSVLIRIFETVIIPISKEKRDELTKRQVMSTSEDSLIQTKLPLEDMDDSKRLKTRKIRRNSESTSRSSLSKKTLFLYHDGAYTEPLEDAFKEIDTWLGKHKNEVVVLRVTTTDDKQADLSADLAGILSVISHTALNEDRNPNLGEAVRTNKRVVLFLRQDKHWHKHDPRIHPIVKLDTTVKLHMNCVETTTLYAPKFKQRQNHHTIQVDWFHTRSGKCNKDLAKFCNAREIDRLSNINSVLFRDYHHPLNIVLVDYVEIGDEDGRLFREIREINENNVRLYG